MSVRVTKSYIVTCTEKKCMYPSSEHEDFGAAIEAADEHINEYTEKDGSPNLSHEVKIETIDLVKDKYR